jgi:hypothetical protein
MRAYYQDYTMLALFNSRERTEEEFSAMAYVDFLETLPKLNANFNHSGRVGLVLGGVFDMGETCLLEYRINTTM